MQAEANNLRESLLNTVKNFFCDIPNAPSRQTLGFLVDEVLKVVTNAPLRKLVEAVETDEGEVIALLDIPESLVQPLGRRLSDLDVEINLREPEAKLIHCETLEEALVALGEPATLRDVLVRLAMPTILSLGSPPEAEIRRLAERQADNQIALFQAHGWTGPSGTGK